MRKFNRVFSLSFMIAAIVLGTVGVQGQRRNDREVRDIVRSLNSKLDDFEYNLNYQMKSSSANRNDVNTISDDLRSLKRAVREYQSNLDQRRENKDDVVQIVESAKRIQQFLKPGGQNRQIEGDWAGVRSQIDRLGANYGVTPNWNANGDEDPQWVKDDPGYPQTGSVKTLSVGMSGTYQLDAAKSEKVDDVIGNTNLGSEQQEDLRDKLEAPEQLAIDIRGNQVTLATSKASPITFTADGRDKTERSPSGKTIRLRATLSPKVMTVSSLGGDTDYTITFTSIDNGRGLKISRRITTDYLNQTVFAESIYDKTDSVARLGIDRSGNPNNQRGSNNPNGSYSDNDQTGNTQYGGTPSTVTGRTGDFIVPNGTLMSGFLDNEINTKVSQNNDRFRLTVQSPDEFRGATLEGYITGVGRSGKITGQSNVTFNFERITLRDGKTYDFAGYLQSIRDQNGKNVKVDSEGTARGDNQTNQTAKRGGIGAGLGAIIGAIAGGGKGAAIGAVLGGGAGAGSVAIQGQGDILLQKGSTITVQSSSPTRQNQPQDN